MDAPSRTPDWGRVENPQRGLWVAQDISFSVKSECHGNNFSAECVPLCVCGERGETGGYVYILIACHQK